MTFEQGHAAVDQQFAVNPVESFDLAVLVGDQFFPVELRLAGRPAKALGLYEVVGKMRAVDQQFLWHATNIHACTTEVAAFGNSHFRAESCGKTRGTDTAGACTNHK
ncbi:hypothetical protein D3C71_1933300 [compost metagenome]